METDTKNREVSSISQIISTSDYKRKVLSDFNIFVLELVKHMVQAGLYADSQPMPPDAIHKLYSLFQSFQYAFGSVTFILSESATQKYDINVEGILSRWIPLRSLLQGAVGEHFIGKLADLFRRNKIVALTLSSTLDEAQFGKFLNLFVSWEWQQGQESLDAFTTTLLDQDVTGVTIVGINELLGSERRLPWQTRVALTRIKKDLRKIPLLKKATPQRIDKLKHDFLAEIARPMKYPASILQLMANADLAAQGLSFITDEEINRLLVKGLLSRHLMETTRHLLSLLKEDKSQNADARGKMQGLLRILALELADRDIDTAKPLLDECNAAGAIAPRDLPGDVQLESQVKRTLETFLSKRKVLLDRMLTTRDAHECTRILNIIMLAIPGLVAQKDTESLNMIGLSLAKLYRQPPPPDFPGRRERIGDVLDGAAKEGVLDKLTWLTCNTPKEQRRGMELLMLLYGSNAVSPLVAILTETEAISVRRAAVDILIQLGRKATEAISGELMSHRHPWYTVRNLLYVLGEIGDASMGDMVREFAKHPHPKVREQFVITAEKLLKNDGEKVILTLLNDNDQTVRKQAITSLARLQCKAPQMIKKMQGVLEGWKKSDKGNLGCLIAVIRALRFYDSIALPEREVFEDLLFDIVKGPKGIRALMPTLTGLHEVPTDVKLLVIETLGYIGGSKSEDMLRRLQKDKDTVVAQRAAEALRRIKGRVI